jgi:hypothetical protein
MLQLQLQVAIDSVSFSSLQLDSLDFKSTSKRSEEETSNAFKAQGDLL